jgi:DNA-binding MarR family transcriptional regulator
LQLLAASEALWNASRVFLDQWNLSPSQFNILNLLLDTPNGCTQVELSRQLIMHRSNVTGLVDRLELRGLVRRQDSKTDRRAFNVVITAQGAELMRQIHPHYYQAAEEIWDGMPTGHACKLATEVRTISASAGRIAAAVASSGSIHGPPKTKT